MHYRYLFAKSVLYIYQKDECKHVDHQPVLGLVETSSGYLPMWHFPILAIVIFI